MSLTTDLKLAYHMGYDDALAKRKPDASKVHLFVKYGTVRPHDIAEVEAVMRRLRELRVGMD